MIADQFAEQHAQVDRVEREVGVGGDQLADVAAECRGRRRARRRISERRRGPG